MKKFSLNKKLNDVNILYQGIVDLQDKINLALREVSFKETRNRNLFDSKLKSFEEQEKLIKTFVDNKYVEFFIDDSLYDLSNVSDVSGFELNERVAAVTKEVSDTLYMLPKKKTANKNGTFLTFDFSEAFLGNELRFSFYSIAGQPLVPTEITVELDGVQENFYEPNFRYYDRAVASDFETHFPFMPKSIEKIHFSFDTAVKQENAYCELRLNSYSVATDDYLLFTFDNKLEKESLKFFKVSDETVVPMKYSYSFDNINFKELKFENEEASIDGTSESDVKKLFIRVSADYSSITKVLEEKTDNLRRNASNIRKSSNSYDLGSVTIQDTFNILFTYSDYNNIKARLVELELDPDNFFEKKSGIYYLKSNFVNTVNTISSEVTGNLELMDDISVVKDDSSNMNFYYCVGDSILYAPAFLSEVDFRIDYSVKYSNEVYPDAVYTPMLFQISVKG